MNDGSVLEEVKQRPSLCGCCGLPLARLLHDDGTVASDYKLCGRCDVWPPVV